MKVTVHVITLINKLMQHQYRAKKITSANHWWFYPQLQPYAKESFSFVKSFQRTTARDAKDCMWSSIIKKLELRKYPWFTSIFLVQNTKVSKFARPWKLRCFEWTFTHFETERRNFCKLFSKKLKKILKLSFNVPQDYC